MINMINPAIWMKLKAETTRIFGSSLGFCPLGPERIIDALDRFRSLVFERGAPPQPMIDAQVVQRSRAHVAVVIGPPLELIADLSATKFSLAAGGNGQRNPGVV